MDGQRGVAGDVGSAIIGELRRRKDGRWDWDRSARRSLEAAVASWVVDLLERDGHRITDLWSPDYNRSRLPERDTRPELAMILDGEPAGLDVTMFTTKARSAAAARAGRIQRAIEARLNTFDDGRAVLGVIGFDTASLIALTAAEVQLGSITLADLVEEAVHAMLGMDERRNLSVPLPWVRGASVMLTMARPGLSRASVYVREAAEDVPALVDTFIAERIDRKADQLRPWGRALLVIVHGYVETANDLRAGFARRGSCRLWRVYWVGASPESVELVASEGPHPP